MKYRLLLKAFTTSDIFYHTVEDGISISVKGLDQQEEAL